MNEEHNNNFDDIKDFFVKYRGAVIGGIIGLVILATGLFKLLAGLIIIAIGIILGNYIQKNKDTVKEKLKNLIDKF